MSALKKVILLSHLHVCAAAEMNSKCACLMIALFKCFGLCSVITDAVNVNFPNYISYQTVT